MRQEQGSVAQVRAERRAAERFGFPGAELFLFSRWNQIGEAKPTDRYTLRLKDMSIAGLSGMTDAPLAVGDIVFAQLEEMLIPAAEVIWVKRTLAGFAFVESLPPARLQRLRDQHEAGQLWSPAMRARSDLPTWWTDVAEHERGRRGIVPRN